MTQTEDLELILTDDHQAGRAMLKRIGEYDNPQGFPGYQPTAADDWQVLYLLGEWELITYGPEPLGTYGPDGREEYGTIIHLTALGREEVETLKALGL